VLARLSGRFSRLRSRPKSVIDGRPNCSSATATWCGLRPSAAVSWV